MASTNQQNGTPPSPSDSSPSIVPQKRSLSLVTPRSSLPSSPSPVTSSQLPLVNIAHIGNQGQVAASNGVINHPALSQTPAWDPAALLNPKGYNSRSTAPRHDPLPAPHSSSNGFANEVNNSAKPSQVMFQFTPTGDSAAFASPSSSPAYHVPAGPNLASNGMGHMIENMNNVQDRSTVPMAKRRKVDDSPEFAKNKFNGGSSGMLADHIKQKQKEAQPVNRISGQTLATLDLTGGKLTSFSPFTLSPHTADIVQMKMVSSRLAIPRMRKSAMAWYTRHMLIAISCLHPSQALRPLLQAAGLKSKLS